MENKKRRPEEKWGERRIERRRRERNPGRWREYGLAGSGGGRGGRGDGAEGKEGVGWGVKGGTGREKQGRGEGREEGKDENQLPTTGLQTWGEGAS